MPSDENANQGAFNKDLMDLIIRLGLIAFLVYACVRIFEPFLGLVLWAMILAVVFYPVHQRLAARIGGYQGRAAVLLVFIGVLLIGVPGAMVGGSFASFVHQFHAEIRNGTFAIQPPAPEIADWPLVGQYIHETWSLAAHDLPALLAQLQPQLGSISKFVLAMVANTASQVFAFFGSMFVAGIMMAYGQDGSRAILRIITRLAGADRGEILQKLSTATIRSVALGVIGIAFIQAILLGIGTSGPESQVPAYWRCWCCSWASFSCPPCWSLWACSATSGGAGIPLPGTSSTPFIC